MIGTVLSANNISLTVFSSWLAGYCYQNKEDNYLSQSKVSGLVEQVGRRNSTDIGDYHKFHNISQMNCFIFVIALV